MQRKLIGYNAFEKLTEGSLPAAQYELVEAESILSDVLETTLTFHNFNKTHVVYETEDGNYVRAGYKVGKDHVLFEGVEELVIDEKSEVDARKNIIRDMIESVLEGKSEKASSHFDEVMQLVRAGLKREAALERNKRVNEAAGAYSRRKPRRGSKAGSGVFVRHGPPDPARSRRAKEGHRKHPHASLKAWETRRRRDPQGARTKRDRKLYGRFRRLAASVVGRKHKKKMTEWLSLTENVFGYVNFVENGAAIEPVVKTTPQGAVASVKIPTSKIRNEGKILAYHLKTLKTDLKVLRETARRLADDRDFVSMVAELKRHNNLSDNEALEECLGDIVSKYPNVLYLTQEELSGLLGDALARSGVGNYDDRTCDFMSEGILRVAHGAYNERVNRIRQLAQSPAGETDDPYVEFQNVVSGFYPSLDESAALEMQVFVDLYNAAVEVRRSAMESSNGELREEAEELADALQKVIEGENTPSLDLATTVAEWLEDIVETNLETSDWEVEKTPHMTVTGEHPQMSKNAKHPYAPASDFSGDWGSELPQLDNDSKGYKSFGNVAKNKSYDALTDDRKGYADQYPTLSNPYVPKAVTPTLKGEPGVDKNMESGLDMYQTGDTFPSLNNPYVPKGIKPHVNDTNRVDDREVKGNDLTFGSGPGSDVGLGGSRIDGR